MATDRGDRCRTHDAPSVAMRRDGVRKGLVTLCIGGGQGIALLLEGL